MNKTALPAFTADCAVDLTGTTIVVERSRPGLMIIIQ